MVRLLVEQVRDRRNEADVQVTTDVRSAYAGRTQSVRRTGCPTGTPTKGWFSLSTAVVSWTFLSTWLVSQFAPFPPDSRIVRESPPVSIHAETPSNGSLRKSESHRQSQCLRLAGGCAVQ